MINKIERQSARSTFHRILSLAAASLMCILLSHLPARADHIHHILYTSSTSWVDSDLTKATHGGVATPYGAIAAFNTTPNNQLHVYYVDSSAQHVHQLYHSTTWSDADLTSFTGGPTAYPYGISGFSIGNLQYVFYVGTDQHVHELNYNNSSWSDQDLTALVGGNSASPAPLVAFATKPNNQFHVYYQDSGTAHEYQLYFNGTSWSYQDLTAIVGTGSAVCYTQWIAGFAIGNQQHLFCPGYLTSSSNLDMLHFSYINNWSVEDVTLASGPPETPMYLGSGVAGYKVPGFLEYEVFAVTDDTHLNRYIGDYHAHTWIDWDATTSWGAPTDAQFGGIVAFMPPGTTGQRYIYYAPSTEVYQFAFTGTAWTVTDLTKGLGQADPNSGLAGFPLGTHQHIFYMSSGN